MTPRTRPTRSLAIVAGVLVGSLFTSNTSALAVGNEQVLELLVAAPSDTSATVLSVDERTWTEGFRDSNASTPPTGDEHFRIGSITKTFVATVIMQLVEDNRIELDAPVGRYLPHVVPGGDRATVRQILQHTSGFPDYMKSDGWSTNRWRSENRFQDYSPKELLAQAFDQNPEFPAGEGFHYSNTNYVIAGLLVEAVTERPYETEIVERILNPLTLENTSFPGSDPSIPTPTIRAVGTLDDGRQVDVTEQNETLDWAAGEMISTTSDLSEFFDSLLGGRLLTAASLDEMRTTVPMGMGFRYGLGLESFDLPCGKQIWGHGGQLLGYVTYAYREDDGRTFTLLQTSGADDGFLRFAAMATAAYCR
ncbi:serine hydrolase domain-containing protein [Rhodococcus sp. NPDC058521]|uniref:serine hydrolase domain-containing protein n=1 Tax=Rhodococcus sp. NPDC058521 TaxID=3346536 RepID=UPI003646C2A2